MNWLKTLWGRVQSNPVFVLVSSTFGGAVVSAAQDELASGRIDWTRNGLNKMVGYALMAGVTAVIHLYRPKPNAVTIPVPQPAVIEPPPTPEEEK